MDAALAESRTQPHRGLQAAQSFRFGCAIPEGASAAELDAWLATLGIVVGPIQSTDALQGHPAGAWLWRVLLLARGLLQAARLPVFDDPYIQRIHRHPAVDGRWACQARFPCVEFVSPQCHELAFRGAARHAAWTVGRPLNDASRRAWFASLEAEVVAPVSPLVMGGKGTIPIMRAAHAMGVPFMHVGLGTFHMGWGSAARSLSRSATSGDSALGARMADSKWSTARLLEIAGLPAPRHHLVNAWPDALAAARSIGWPVVVKPADLERGEGVTVNVEDEAQLQLAFDHALSLSRRGQVIVEQQVAGVCHRVFISHGRMLYAVKRMPMSVSGDGKRTIAELVADALASDTLRPPWERSGIQPIDELALSNLARAGWAPDDTPPAQTWVPLRRIESTAWGGVDEDVSALIHPDNIEAALRATSLVGLEVAGVDIITPDIAQPWHATGAIINEVNYAPLLGGGEISRSHLPEFIRRLMGKRLGRIPVEAYVGGAEAQRVAEARWRELNAQGLRCSHVDAGGVRDPDGAAVHQAGASSITRRTRALLVDARVDAVVIAMTPEALRRQGMPAPGVRLTHVADAPPAHAISAARQSA